jgi:hypothetical protein
MAYQTISNYNITGMDDIFVYLANEISVFIPFLLLGIYLTVSLSIYYGTRRFQGQADFFVAFATAGFFTSIVGIVMSLTFGIINNFSLILILFLTVISIVLLLMKRNRD